MPQILSTAKGIPETASANERNSARALTKIIVKIKRNILLRGKKKKKIPNDKLFAANLWTASILNKLSSLYYCFFNVMIHG